LQLFKDANIFVNSVISDDFAVSLSVDITARFVNYSSVLFDLWNVLNNCNLLKLRSTALRTAVIGKLSLWWPQTPFSRSQSPVVVFELKAQFETYCMLYSVICNIAMLC